MAENVLEVKAIEKSFSGNPVLKSVDFSVRKGEIHGLMGENGAGKSTLIKIITGVYTKDSGQIFVNGREVDIKSRKDSAACGISVIYQELSVVSSLTVAQNVFLGQELTHGVILSQNEMNERVAELIKKYNFDLHPEELVETLSIAKRQTVEILKALASDSNIIIMDEPTASLTGQESETLFGIIEGLKSQGKSIIYISHRLEEVNMLCDRLTILRDGRLVGVVERENMSMEGTIRMMVGKDVSTEKKVLNPIREGAAKLEVRELYIGGVLNGVSFTAYGGQILGIGGLVGSGRTETLLSIFGLMPYDAGTITLNGKPLYKSARKNVRAGIGLVSEDRRVEGFVHEMSLRENSILASLDLLSRGNFLMRNGYAKKKAIESMEKTNIQPAGRPDMWAINLSGGNQQKLVISKWIMRDDLQVMMFDEPTVGIDVGAKSEIYAHMEEMAAEGKIVIMVSSDLEELVKVSDRILVMYKGEIFKELDNVNTTEEDILIAASGIDADREESNG